MTKKVDLPVPLSTRPFRTSEALLAGVEPSQLRLAALQSLFHGVRSVGLDETQLLDRCRAYAPRMHASGAFSHVTAAVLWNIPLPLGCEPRRLDVTVPAPMRAPGGAGIAGHSQVLASPPILHKRGFAIASPADAWCQLADSLGVDDLIAAGEYAITGDPFQDVLPLATLEELRASVETRAHGRGHRKRLAALSEMREGPLSRPETLVRILAVRCGIPEPVINQWIQDERGSDLAMPDLAWKQWKVALEYEGDFHREKGRFRKDIRRIERLIDLGWVIIKVSANDLFDAPDEVVYRIEHRLRSRGWTDHADSRQVTRFVR